MNPRVGIVMGSASDWPTMERAAQSLVTLGIPHEVRVYSAHRTPDELLAYMTEAEERGVEVWIAGAGGAAHLAGVMAAKTLNPVLGVPVDSKYLKGLDSLLSMVQMPAGIPVGTLAIGTPGAANAGLFAGHILALKYPEYREALERFRAKQRDKALANPDPRS
ncbi:MAG: 5-(carboxyamino)imidazole ribonucleotide mutase [Thermoanaerobaculia bacterium]